MPTYEYACKDCGHRLEAFQRMSDDPLVDCPDCEKPELKRLVSAAAFQLKGNGWYQTDFKNSGKQEPTKDSATKETGGKQEAAKDSGQPAPHREVSKEAASGNTSPKTAASE